MRRLLLASLTVLLVLSPATACAAEPGPGPAGPATALTLPPRADGDQDDDASTRAAPPADGDDVAACFDGDCEVTVPDGTTIRVDPRFEVEGVLVTVSDGRGRIRIETATGYSSTGGIGSTTIQDDLSVQLLAVEGDTATVRLRAS